MPQWDWDTETWITVCSLAIGILGILFKLIDYFVPQPKDAEEGQRRLQQFLGLLKTTVSRPIPLWALFLLLSLALYLSMRPTGQKGVDISTYNFEDGTQQWKPDEDSQGRKLASDLTTSTKHAYAGSSSLEFEVRLMVPRDPTAGRGETGQIVVDRALGANTSVSAHIYIPSDAPGNLGGRMFLYDSKGKRIEQAEQIPLMRESWTSFVWLIYDEVLSNAPSKQLGVQLYLSSTTRVDATNEWTGKVYVDAIDIIPVQARPAPTAIPTPTAIPIPTLTPTPTPTPTLPPVEPTPTPVLQNRAYTVRAGDKIDEIADIFYPDTSTRQARDRIVAANPSVFGDHPPYLVYKGQILILPDLPDEVKYKVREHDTLEGIAARFFGELYGDERPVDEICSRNRDVIGDDCDVINPGQVLKIPLRNPPPPGTHLVRLEESLSSIAVAYYGREEMRDTICELNRETIGKDCALVFPGRILELPPGMLPAQSYKARYRDTLESISRTCYGDEDKASRIHLVNKKIIGDSPPRFIHSGQILTLYGCE